MYSSNESIPSSLSDIDASIQSFQPIFNQSCDRLNDDDPMPPSDIPTFIYIVPHRPLESNKCKTFDSPSQDQQRTNPSSPRTVSICSLDQPFDDQQQQASTQEIQDMKRMIHDMKHNPSLIYKRLCVRYDDGVIRRGSDVMNEVVAKCGEK